MCVTKLNPDLLAHLTVCGYWRGCHIILFFNRHMWCSH